MKGFGAWVWVGLVVGSLGLFGLGGILLGSASAETPWNEGLCDDYDGHGVMGRGMMGRGMMDDWDEDCPLFGDASSSLWGRSDRDDAKALNIEEVEETVATLLADLDKNLVLAEVMEFDNHFYAEAIEIDTGIGAYELLIDRYTGKVYPEMGPNMMWNEKYGMMGGGHGMMGNWSRSRDFDPTKMTVSPEEAVELAQEYLERKETGFTPDDEVTSFYGYYTLHTLNDGEIEGMLSVNGDSGQVWYHTWHDDFVRMSGGHHEESPGHDGDTAHATDVPGAELASYADISANELAAMLKNKDFPLINVHIPYDGEIRNTDLFIPFDEIGDNLDLLPADKNAEIVIYCRSGSMSATAANYLVKRGYTNVYNLKGGMKDWKETGHDLLQIVQ